MNVSFEDMSRYSAFAMLSLEVVLITRSPAAGCEVVPTTPMT